MTDYPGNLPPAGWYPDPYGAPYERWWDGALWTEHTNIPVAAEPEAPMAAADEPVVAEPEQPGAAAEPIVFLQPDPAPYKQPEYSAPETPHYEVYEPSAEQPTEQPVPSSDAIGNRNQAATVAAEQNFDDIFSSLPASAATNSTYEQPSYRQPSYETPMVQQPSFEQSSFGQPDAARGATSGFDSLIAGARPVASTDFSAEADPFETWSNDGGLYIEPPRNTPASVGATFGVLSFVLPGLGGVIGLIFSALGLRRAAQFKKEDGQAVGQRRSIAGIALSVIGTAASLALVLFVIPGIINPSASTDAGGSQTDDGSSVVADAPVTANNNIALEQGAQGTIIFPGTTDPSIQFTVTGITVAPDCTEDPELVLSPDNGQFVAITMDFTTAANYYESMTGGTPLQVAMTDFTGLLPDGTEVVNTANGLSCVPEAEQLPTEIAAGQVTSGTIVLDLTEATSSFTYSPSGVTDLDPAATRWEWAIPR